MKTWGRRLAKLTLAATLIALALLAWAHWLGNRDVPAVTQAEIDLRYAKAMAWLRANETTVDASNNAALWWMVQAAAQRTGDPYLHELLARAESRMFPPGQPPLPWKRMLHPRTEGVTVANDLSRLHAYQRFFHHALTCVAAQGPGGDSSLFLETPVCRPVWRQLVKGDAACSTHQLMGLKLFRQTGCMPPRDLAPLEAELAGDIVQELTLDPVMKDAYIQRVLMLVWQGHADQVKPVWLRRVLEAQNTDGGWQGHRRMPELPSWLQPWEVRERLARRWPRRFSPEKVDKDFHATAQGLLLLALLRPHAGGRGAAVAAPPAAAPLAGG